ncbi:MAG: PDZ domain-containing protein, partial [Desulfatitalea sp.]|nr:PDZ domain-containing protein [Desulfatitalea sp.]NNJ98825.1 PDZ domain-containing protein [Desulfatitalea sp.]
QVAQGSTAAMAGLQPGDVIVEVDQQQVTDPAEFERLSARNQKEGHLLLLLDRNGTTIFLTLAVP